MSSQQSNSNDNINDNDALPLSGGEIMADAKLNTLNYLNVVFYILNVVVTYGVGVLGWVGKNNSEISDQYQTLVTPKSTAFSIWSIIFIFQLIFVIVQLLPKFRASHVVQKGVGYYYVLTCFFQGAWTVSFSLEIFWLSMLLITMIWKSLVAIVYSQYYIEAPDMNDSWSNALADFWLLRFPFAIHCGWVTAATLVGANLTIVDLGYSTTFQATFAVLSLAILHAAGVWVTFAIRKPNVTIAAVLVWALGWVHAELKSPKATITDRFNEDVIAVVKSASGYVAIIIGTQLVVRILWSLFNLGEKLSGLMSVFGLGHTDPHDEMNVITENGYYASNDSHLINDSGLVARLLNNNNKAGNNNGGQDQMNNTAISESF